MPKQLGFGESTLSGFHVVASSPCLQMAFSGEWKHRERERGRERERERERSKEKEEALSLLIRLPSVLNYDTTVMTSFNLLFCYKLLLF